MKKRVSKKKFQTKFFAAFVFFLVIIVIQGSIALSNIFKQRESSIHLVSTLISQDSKNMSDLFSRIDSFINIMETDENFIYNATNNVTGDIFLDTKQFHSLQSKFSTMVSNSIKDSAYYNSFLFLNNEVPLSYIAPEQSNSINLKLHIASSNIYSIKSIEQADWFHNLKIHSEPLIWVEKINDRHILCYAKKLYIRLLEHSHVSTRSLGVFYVAYDLKTLLGQFEIMETYPSATITLLYNNQSIYQAGKLDSQETKRLLSYTRSIYPSLTLTTNILRNDVNTQFTIQITVGIVLILLTLVFCLLAFFYTNKKLIMPIIHLSKHLLSNQLEKIIFSDSLIPEVEVLYKNHNYMCDHIATAMDENRKSYYKMLQLQINPHFIYNVLNTISSVSLTKGEFDIAKAISNLVEMIRYGIHFPDELVCLENEIRIIKKFIAIQNFRYNNNISVDFDIPDTLPNIKLPKLTLQPLIENSVFHNDKDLISDSINISLHVCVSESDVIIKIYDYNSIDPEKLNNHLVSSETNSTDTQRGLGIRNIHNRLSFLYGEKYGLHYISDKGGLCTIVTLPLITD